MAEIASINNIDVVVAGPVSGLIFMWHGTLANIPAGYVLCDGNNSTPNLLDQFVQQVLNGSTDPGSTGGSTSKSSVNHAHSSGNHRHYSSSSGGGYGTGNFNTLTSGYTRCRESHGHSGYTNYKVPGNMSNNDENWTDGRPKYYEIALIMKS